MNQPPTGVKMSSLIYPDIAAVTAAISTNLIDISHADDGEPGTGTIRGTFPEGVSWANGIDQFADAVAALGIAITSGDSDGETAILALDWRNGISRERAEEIIAEEEMDCASLGCVECLTISNDGTLRDDSEAETADLTSEDAFRAQVVNWRTACA